MGKTVLYARESVAFDTVLNLRDEAGEPLDITGWTFALQLARQAGTPEITLGMVSAGAQGFTIVGGESGELRMRVNQSTLAGVTDTTGNFTMFGDLLGTPSGGGDPEYVSDVRLNVTTAGIDFPGSTYTVALELIGSAAIAEIVSSAAEYAETASQSADRAEAAAGVERYFTTIAEGVAATSAPNTFSSREATVENPDGELRVYDHTGAQIYDPRGGLNALEGRVDDVEEALAGKTSVVGDLSTSIGSGQEYASISAFRDWLKTVIVMGTVVATLVGHDVAGSHTVDATDLRYAGVGEVILQGAPFNISQGAYDITDLPDYDTPVSGEAAFLVRKAAIVDYGKTQFNASIKITGSDDLTGHTGMGGWVHLKRLLIDAHGRYSIDNGFNGSHGNSNGGARTQPIEDCLVVGGVWGGIGSSAQITPKGTRVTYACQISGGPLDMIHGKILCDANTEFKCYFPLVTTPFANMPQVCINLENADFECGVGKFEAWGPFKHGFFARKGSQVIAPNAKFTHVSQPVTAIEHSHVRINTFDIRNANPAESSATAGAEQTNIIGNSNSKFAIFAGGDSTVTMDGGTFTDCDGLYGYIMADGGTAKTYSKITAVSSRVSVAGGVGEFAAINGGLLIGQFGLVTPIAGGNEWFFVDRGGRIILEGNDGTLGYNIPRNSMKNGSAIFDMANPNYSDGAVWVGGVRMLKAQGAAVADPVVTYAVSYSAPAVSYAGPSGGATIDEQARASLSQLATDVGAVRTALAALAADVAEVAVDNGAVRTALGAVIDRLEAHRLIST